MNYMSMRKLLWHARVKDFDPDPERMKSWMDRNLVKGFYVGTEFYLDLDGFTPPALPHTKKVLFDPGEWYQTEQIVRQTGYSRQAVWRKVRFHNIEYKIAPRFQRKMYRGDQLNAIFAQPE